MTTWKIIPGDTIDGMRTLSAGCCRCCVTSPPYWGLRDYGVDGQIGLEPTPDEYIARMVGVFREVRRVLRDDGTLWLNMGDVYATNAGQATRGGPPSASSTLEGNGHRGGGPTLATLARVGGPGWGMPVDADLEPHARRRQGTDCDPKRGAAANGQPMRRGVESLKSKDLLGLPWLLAFALRADGWYLRSDIIWHKPNPMPESVTDRPTKSHEYVFLLSKSARYYYDAEAIAEPASENTHARISQDLAAQVGSFRANGGNKTNGPMRAVMKGTTRKIAEAGSGVAANRSYESALALPVENRNCRTVWSIPTQAFSGAHFATFPERLAERCIRAGSAPGDTVLDPFAGSGTTLAVAVGLARNGIGCELNPQYVEMARRRVGEIAPLLATEQAAVLQAAGGGA